MTKPNGIGPRSDSQKLILMKVAAVVPFATAGVCPKKSLVSSRAGILLRSTAIFFLSACSAYHATLSWRDTSENAEGFRIYRIANSEKKFIAQVGPSVTQYIDNDAPPGACYIVAAFNTAGESPSANSACQTP